MIDVQFPSTCQSLALCQNHSNWSFLLGNRVESRHMPVFFEKEEYQNVPNYRQKRDPEKLKDESSIDESPEFHLASCNSAGHFECFRSQSAILMVMI